jgi:DNA-binding transcriptional ArsR family regulator
VTEKPRDQRAFVDSEGLIRILLTEMPKRNGPGIELLADPTRRRIIAALAVAPRRPSTLARDLGLSRPAITRQLKLLTTAGLVCVGRSLADGRVRLYGIKPGSHGPITAWLAGTNVGRPMVMRIDEDEVLRIG